MRSSYCALLLLVVVYVGGVKGDDCHSLPDCVDVSNVTKCELCKWLIEITTKEVRRGNQTYHDLVNVIKDLCGLIGGELVEQECNFFLDNLTKIEELIMKGYSPEYICRLFHMCPSMEKIGGV